MKSYRVLSLLLVASLLLAACRGPQATATQEPTQPPEEEVSEPTPTEAEPIKPTVEPTAEPTPTEAGVEGVPDLGGKTVTVAVENAYPPFNKIDEATNEGVGWDYDTVREICKRLNCVPEFKEAAWDGIFPAMEAGEFDMLADGVTYTAERDEIVDFSIPYVTVGQVLLVRADETATVDELKADASKLVGTQIGTTNEIVAKKNFPEERVQSFEDFPATVLALIAGDIDGVVIDNVSALGFIKENEGKIKIGGQLTSDEQLAFVFPPGSYLTIAVNAALSEMIADGTLDQINRLWGLVQ
jgi:polar amino acid transport system substrate-binding protein